VNSFEHAADHLQSLFGPQFPLLTREHWLAQAEGSFKTVNGRLQSAYDLALARTLEDVPPDGVLPPLWNHFEALAASPLLVIRGSNSDILSPATVQAMQARRDDMQICEVPDQGHPPSLDDKETIERIAAFIAGCEPRR
jgi:pimeloyl-ACP methyl ester carboxylesterase